jgi:two-component system response regulator WspF
MKLAVVNDVAMIGRYLEGLIAERTEWELVWTATGGLEALRLCRQDPPDLILMDLVMPEMNGAEVTRAVMAHSPCAILVVTAGVARNAALVFEALGAGAMDAVDLPIGNDEAAIEALIHKIHNIGRLIGFRTPQTPRDGVCFEADAIDAPTTLVAIGASTGGPAALKELLGALPVYRSAALVIVQHLDERFADGLAQWLDRVGPWPVRVAREGEAPQPGVALLTRTNDHLVFAEPRRLHYSVEPRDLVYRPSVDVFLFSAAKHWTGPLVGVLLTGMGSDGAAGLQALRKLGHHAFVQDQASCAVYGMPKAAMALGAAEQQLAPAGIARALVPILSRRERGRAGRDGRG